MAIENKTKLGVTWTRNDWSIGDAITEPKMDSIENGIYILMNEVYENAMNDRLIALEKEIGGTRDANGYNPSRLDTMERDVGAGREALGLLGAGNVADSDMNLVEQVKNQQNTIDKLIALLEQNHTIDKSYFVRWPFCENNITNESEAISLLEGTLRAQKGRYVFESNDGVNRYGFPICARHYSQTVVSYLLQAGVTETSGVYSGTVKQFREGFSAFLAHFQNAHVIRISFDFNVTDPDAAFRFVYGYSNNEKFVDYNYYQREKLEWAPMTFMSGEIDGKPLHPTHIEELSYGNNNSIELRNVHAALCDTHTEVTGEETWALVLPTNFSRAVLNLNAKKILITHRDGHALSEPIEIKFDFAPAVAKQGYKHIPTKTIINSIE